MGMNAKKLKPNAFEQFFKTLWILKSAELIKCNILIYFLFMNIYHNAVVRICIAASIEFWLALRVHVTVTHQIIDNNCWKKA